MQKAKALQPPTERERLFVAAAEAFFLEPASSDYWLRIRRWEQASEKVYAAFPDDPEAAAFYALAHLAVAPSDATARAYSDRAAEILLRVYERNPDHPGAMHYLVHANDVPGRERESLEITRKYESAAPRNPHALHMPTHIYTRLGDWDGVIRGNLLAAEAALEYPAGDHGEFVWDEFPHAIEYLVYSNTWLCPVLVPVGLAIDEVLDRMGKFVPDEFSVISRGVLEGRVRRQEVTPDYAIPIAEARIDMRRHMERVGIARRGRLVFACDLQRFAFATRCVVGVDEIVHRTRMVRVLLVHAQQYFCGAVRIRPGCRIGGRDGQHAPGRESGCLGIIRECGIDLFGARSHRRMRSQLSGHAGSRKNASAAATNNRSRTVGGWRALALCTASHPRRSASGLGRVGQSG